MAETFKILANGEELEVPVAEDGAKQPGMTVMVHQQGINVEVPDAVEISGITTIKTMSEMNQKQWEWISTGDVFQIGWNYIWQQAYGDLPYNATIETAYHAGSVPGFEIPKTIEALLKKDPGLVHVAGLIVQLVECVFAGKKPFFRCPETHLHPKVERVIVPALRLIGGMAQAANGGSSDYDPVITETPVVKDPDWAKLMPHIPKPKKSIWENIGKEITFRFGGEVSMRKGKIVSYNTDTKEIELEYEGEGGIWMTKKCQENNVVQVRFAK